MERLSKCTHRKHHRHTKCRHEKWKFIFLRAQIKSYFRRELYPLPEPERQPRKRTMQKEGAEVAYAILPLGREHIGKSRSSPFIFPIVANGLCGINAIEEYKSRRAARWRRPACACSLNARRVGMNDWFSRETNNSREHLQFPILCRNFTVQ